MFVRIPTLFPLAGPSFFPPGIVGSTSLGVAGLHAILAEFFQYSEKYRDLWLHDPMLVAWLNSVAASPSLFAIDTMAYADLQHTVNKTPTSSITFASPWSDNLWCGMERTLCFRLLLDVIMQFNGENERPRRAFLGYLTKTHHDLYLAESPFGPKPVELAFELLYLRLPT
jgi:hypothetical protein